MNKPTLSRSPFALSPDVTEKPLALEPCAVLVLDATGKILSANATTRLLWQTGDGEITGEHFATLMQFDLVSDEADWLASQWEVLLANTLDKSAPLTALPREGAPRDVIVRLEKLSGTAVQYVATVQPPPRAGIVSASSSAAAALDLLSEKGIAGIFDLHLKVQRVHFSQAGKNFSVTPRESCPTHSRPGTN